MERLRGYVSHLLRHQTRGDGPHDAASCRIMQIMEFCGQRREVVVSQLGTESYCVDTFQRSLLPNAAQHQVVGTLILDRVA